ncbi:MAG: hypothetical protein FVQ79_03030 [Planctomycetes bacterium]|nr:hypothetical protein [Planctomycetota bacterium]
MFWVIIWAITAMLCNGYAETASQQPLFSTLSARAFYEIAQEMYTDEYANDAEIEQAIVFLEAAVKLDPRPDYIYEAILIAASRITGPNDTDKIYQAFRNYLKTKVDLEVTRKTVQQLLANKNSRMEREKVLEKLLRITAGKNDELSSQLATQLGILAAERADFENAKNYLARAYSRNPYNPMAFRGLRDVYESIDQEVNPYVHARHLRFAMSHDPLDINVSMAFARYAESMAMNDIAADAYEYSARLFIYLKPEEPLASSIYTPWAIASYNTKNGWKTCMEIADWLRSAGNIDLVIEALAGRAAIKAKRIDEGQKILVEAAKKADEQLKPDVIALDVTPIELAWFHCFGLEDTKKALVWANRAYSDDAKSPHVKAILAYCLVLGTADDQSRQVLLQSAREMLAGENGKPLYETNQIAALAMGLVMRDEGNPNGATELFKSAISMDPMSLAAERAAELLDEMNIEYEKLEPPQELIEKFRKDFGGNIVPAFTGIQDIVGLQFTLDTSSLSYGHSFDGNLKITNKRSEPLGFSDESMFKGYIRIDAEISDDISVKIPKLISKRIRPTTVWEQNQQTNILLRLNTGMLRRLLIAYPQASLNIEFTLYFDPIVTATGKITNRIDKLEPLKAKFARPGAEITRRSLMRSQKMIAKGQFKQKIRAGQLFAGLLLEQDIQKKIKLPYQAVKVDRALLVRAVKRSLADDNWSVGIQMMSTLMNFTPPFDYDIIHGVSGKLNSPQWPVRLLAVYFLDKAQGENFKSVLDWTRQNETSEIVRKMITALGGTEKTPVPIYDPDN